MLDFAEQGSADEPVDLDLVSTRLHKLEISD